MLEEIVEYYGNNITYIETPLKERDSMNCSIGKYLVRFYANRGIVAYCHINNMVQ